MIGYITVGTNNLEKALAFYDDLFPLLGASRVMEFEKGAAYGTSMTAPGYGVMTPYNGEPHTVSNGGMIALTAPSRAKVDEVHAKALALGGSCEGEPGVRSGGFYAAYFRDLDGNKINVFCMGENGEIHD